MNIRPRCKNCNKKFYSTSGKENCGACSRELGLVKRITINRGLKKKYQVCDDINKYKIDIMLLSTKEKWGLMNPIDSLRVCNLYVNVKCDTNKYAGSEPDIQVKLMLHELREILVGYEPVKSPRSGRAVVQLNGDGSIKREFESVKKCCTKLKISNKLATKLCNGDKVRFRVYDLKWKDNYILDKKLLEQKEISEK